MEIKLCFLSRKTSFVSMMTLTTSFFLVEIIVGYLTNSMALVADSFHMLSDLVSLLVGFLALRYSKIGKRSGRYTFGWARAEVLGALVNSVFLVALCFSILVESFKRMVIPEPIEDARLVLIVGSLGLLVNVIGLFLFHQHGHSHSHGGSHGHSHGSKKRTKQRKGKDTKKQITSGHDSSDDECSEPKTPMVLSVVDGNPVGEEDSCDDIMDSVEEGILVTTRVPTEDGGFNTLPLIEGDKDRSSLFGDMSKEERKKHRKAASANQLNIRGVYLHVLGDALGSVIVIISALIIMHQSGKWTYYVDPTMSVIMVLIILKTSIPLLKESALILMQTVPTHLKIQEIQDKLVDQIPQVQSVHEFHVWQLAGHRIIASAHVRCHTVADYMAIANKLKEFFHNEGIHSTTIQPEFEERLDQPRTDSPTGCMLECGPDKNCQERTCCGPQKSDNLKRRNTSSDPSNSSIKEDGVDKVTVL